MARSIVDRVRAAVGRFVDDLDLSPGSPILVGVSGGQDSVCLLDALAATATTRHQVVVGHVDHRLRGAQSAADASFVANLAEQLGVPALALTVDAAHYADAHRLGLEEAARVVRYQALAVLATEASAGAVATGHTLDDCAEGVLMNLLRGTGLAGQQGIQPEQRFDPLLLGPVPPELRERLGASVGIRLVRPLLGVQRTATEAYCRARGLPFRTDPTNADPSLSRNRIRHHLLPLLRTYNPSIVVSLARLARVAGDEDAELEHLAETCWQTFAELDRRRVHFRWSDWATLSAALQRRLLRRAARELGVTGGWSFDALEAARLLLARRPPGRRLALPSGVRLTTTRTGFQLATAPDQD